MNEVLNFTLLHWGNYTLTVGDLLTVFLIFVATKILMWVVRKAVTKRYSAPHNDYGRRIALIQVTGYVVWTFAILLMVQAAGIKITLLLAGSAALLVGIGLGLQQTFNDFISGFILLIDRTIEMDDVIEIDGMVARVDRIGIRTSILVTRDDIVVVAPNSHLTSRNVINWSHSKKEARFELGVGVAYGSDVERVRSVLMDCAAEHEQVLKDPPSFVRLEEFGNSSVNFALYFWTTDIFRVESIKSDLRFLIAKKLRENDITIPFPQMDVYIKEGGMSHGNQP